MKRPIPEMWSLTIGWTNPYTEPPKGLPRRLMNIKGKRRIIQPIKELINDLVYPSLLGSGYSVMLTNITEHRTQSAATKAKSRTTRQTNKLKKKYPLFWKELLSADQKKRPRYYNGE